MKGQIHGAVVVVGSTRDQAAEQHDQQNDQGKNIGDHPARGITGIHVGKNSRRNFGNCRYKNRQNFTTFLMGLTIRNSLPIINATGYAFWR